MADGAEWLLGITGALVLVVMLYLGLGIEPRQDRSDTRPLTRRRGRRPSTPSATGPGARASTRSRSG